ncbi:MAG: YfcC family protein [Cetobacterium sp.]|uniref:YfcC family protein n=1 Tax=Cetobacterium sp. TaxID=2071632 RepID=UPI002FCA4F05
MSKKFKMPSAYTILICLIAVVAILTWIVPAGIYDYVDPTSSNLQPIPGTYKAISSNPQGLWEIVNAPIIGFSQAQDIALFIIVIGGFLGVVMKTGAIDAGVQSVIKNFKGKETHLIPILMVLFSLGGTTFGMAEETVAFYPIIIPVFIAAGFDTITAMATILLGTGIGVLNSTVNPFATGVASGFAGISIGDGLFLRVILLIIQLAIVAKILMHYANKILKNPESSYVYSTKLDDEEHFFNMRNSNVVIEFTKKKKLILFIFGMTFIVMILAVIPWARKFNITFFESLSTTLKELPAIGVLLGDIVPLGDWWFGEMTVLFLISSVLIGIVDGMNEKEILENFLNGAKDLLGVALIVGISRGITVVMNAGGMTYTILNWGETHLAGLGKIPFIIFTYLFYIPMSFLIPSTSGLATLTMPIMAPLSEFSGVAKNIVVTAYQSASGLVNLVTPTSAVVMGGLAISRIGYGTWIKFVLKILAVLFFTTLIGLIIASFV